MQVSSRSWHMRLVRLTDNYYQPKNLCRHFWRTLFMMAVLPLMGVVALPVALPVGVFVMILLAALFIMYFPIYGFRTWQKIKGESDGDSSKVHPWWVQSKKASKPKAIKHREPNIFIEWVKAKKQRVCPLIEVIEVEKGE